MMKPGRDVGGRLQVDPLAFALYIWQRRKRCRKDHIMLLEGVPYLVAVFVVLIGLGIIGDKVEGKGWKLSTSRRRR